MDFVTGLPESEGYDAIWVVIDHLTKMAHFVACHTSIKAEEFGRLFIQNIFRLHGMPHDIVSDTGSLFTSEFWKKATEGWQIQRKLSTAFHPQTDGQTERTNAIMEQYLRAYVNYQQDDWTDKFPMAEFAYNNAKQETIKESPC